MARGEELIADASGLEREDDGLVRSVRSTIREPCPPCAAGSRGVLSRRFGATSRTTWDPLGLVPAPSEIPGPAVARRPSRGQSRFPTLGSSPVTVDLSLVVGDAARALYHPGMRARTEHALRKFAPLLGDNPRAMKLFVNTYSVFRAIRTLEGNTVELDVLALWCIVRVRCRACSTTFRRSQRPSREYSNQHWQLITSQNHCAKRRHLPQFERSYRPTWEGHCSHNGSNSAVESSTQTDRAGNAAHCTTPSSTICWTQH
ncbi:hypothetical protein SAMN04489729_0310 [Amycolatopsis lurida]|nr:hypothetical protein SAMN04489729_0310 [Amycolatopsis lurida]